MSKTVWSARGQDGQVGPSGQRGGRGSGSGGNGGPGTSGGNGSNGLPGGTIHALLAWQPEQTVAVTGWLNQESQSSVLRVADGQSLHLDAHGGAGGHGGDGGHGGAGAQGYSGSDATRYSSGTNGGPGGDGGRGGAAGSGGNAGPGGRVDLYAAFADSDLLLAVSWDVEAGQVGLPGAPGQGGAGGPGGPGGSSYSWTETESYTDSEGNTQYRTNTHYNSGGSSGPSGSSGASGRAGSPGKPSPAGKFLLHLDQAPYPDRYRFRCSGYRLVATDDNEIFEFGSEHNLLSGLQVSNVGPAPSPGQYVLAYLARKPGLKSLTEPQALTSVPCKGKVEVSPFHFALEELPEGWKPPVHARYKETRTVSPHLHFSRLKRDDPEFSQPTEIEVTFPVSLETVLASTSLAPGVELTQSWRVHNHSSKPFPPPNRQLLMHIETEEAEGARLTIKRESGEDFEIDLSGRLITWVEAIPPGECVTITARVSVPEDTKPYTKASLTAGLRLTPRAGGEARLIQVNPTEYNVAMVQEPRPSEVCLVTHHGCQATEVGGWLDLFTRLGLSVMVWDASYHGGWPILELAPFIKGKLMVCLDTGFETPDRSLVRLWQLMDLREFRMSLAEFGVSYYFLGEKGEVLDFLVSQPQEARSFASVSEYVKALKSGDGPNPEVPDQLERTLDRVGVSRFFVAGEPRVDYLEDKGKELLEKLKRLYPHQQFLVTTIFQPKEEDQGWLRNKSCGVLEVRRLLDCDARAVVVREVQRLNGVRPEFLHSSENLLGLFSAQDFDDKMDMLKRLGGHDWVEWEAMQEALADALLLDFLEEQMAIRKSTGRFNSKVLTRILNRTVEFCGTDLRDGQALLALDTPLGKTVIRLLAGLNYITAKQLSQWDHRVRFLGGTADVEINNFLLAQIDRFLDTNFGHDRLFGTGQRRKDAEQAMRARELELEAQRQVVAQQSGGALSMKESSVEALVRWELRDFLKSGGRLDSFLWSQLEMDEHRNREEEHRIFRGLLAEVYQTALKESR